jgi:PAS domain S-box-containing protein
LTGGEFDHTETLETLEALERTGRRFKDLLEAVPAVIYEAGVGDDGRWRYVSPQLRWILGDEPEDWIANPHCYADRLHPDDRDAVFHMEHHEVEIARGESASFVSEYRMRHRDGRTIWVRDEAYLVTSEEEPPFWRGVLVDITAERRAGHALAETYERVRDSSTLDPVERTGPADVFRISCAACGAVTASLERSPCSACGSEKVESESMDDLLADLKAARHEVSDLLDGIQRHLETLGSSLHGGAAGAPRRVVSRLPDDPLAR